MKKRKPAKTKAEDLRPEYPHRLIELDAELYATPKDATPPSLPMITDLKTSLLNKDEILRFTFEGKPFAVGHTDFTFAGANHARGVRHIRLYGQSDEVILSIDGDFELQQFGTNFKFRTLKTYVPGEWEAVFLAMTDELSANRAEKKEAFRKRRAKDHALPRRTTAS